MRFTPEILRQHAQLLAEKEAAKNRDILAIYLRGSLLYGSPLIDGAGDIDLVFIHASPPEQERQIRKLTPLIHFDIEHHDLALYRSPKDLRVDPWFGPALRDAVPIHDTRHILDYTQSGVRSNFDFPENVQARSGQLIGAARQFWLERQITPPQEALTEIPAFLSALEKAANAVASLSGPPLAARRLGMDLPQRAEALGAPGLAIAFNHLLGAVNLPSSTLATWLDNWKEAMAALQKNPAALPILAEQQQYFLAALEKHLFSRNQGAGLWPLLITWCRIITSLPDLTALQTPWIKAITALGFAGDDYQVRLAAFDGFLDICETLIQGETSGAA